MVLERCGLTSACIFVLTLVTVMPGLARSEDRWSGEMASNIYADGILLNLPYLNQRIRAGVNSQPAPEALWNLRHL